MENPLTVILPRGVQTADICGLPEYMIQYPSMEDLKIDKLTFNGSAHHAMEDWKERGK